MSKFLYAIAILGIFVLSGMASAATTERRWELANGYYGYPAVTSTLFSDEFCVVTSDIYDNPYHFKAQESSVSTAHPSGLPDNTHKAAQAWFSDGASWALNENLGVQALSNIIEYKGNLYVSVDLANDTSAVMEFDGYSWSEMNNTDWSVSDMQVFDNSLFVVKNGTSKVIEFNGLAFSQPYWSNLTEDVTNLAVYQDTLYLRTEDRMYSLGVGDDNLTELDQPAFGVFPIPFTVYDGNMYGGYRNQIYSFDGSDWSLVKVIDPLFQVSSMYPDGNNLYIGTRSNPYDNETKIFIYDGNNLLETTVAGNIVYTLDVYGGTVYAGTNLGLYSLTVTTIADVSRLGYVEWSAFIIGLILLLVAAFTWNEGFEDAMLIGGGLALFTFAGLLLAFPSLYLSYVTLVIPLVVFFVFTFSLNYLLNIQFSFRHLDKDLRVIAVFLVIMLIIEIATQVFSKAIGL